MTTKELYNICQLLLSYGIDKSFDANHDIIYIPVFENKGDIAKELEKIGCHWDEDANSWAIF